ncbi:MAG: helix-turn-helix domain-containing protein [Nocardioidaceae bacterium]
MTAQIQATQTYLPGDTGERVADIYSFLAAHSTTRGEEVAPRYLLVGADEHDQVEIPADVHRVLLQVVEALHSGRAVTVAPQSLTLTTQQAADLLGVSRPTVVRLIDGGHLRAEKVGNRRRLLLDDVLAYRESRRQEQYAALDALAVEIEEEEDVADVLEELRATRKAVAARQRGIRS